jgi:hypothetical protein
MIVEKKETIIAEKFLLPRRREMNRNQEPRNIYPWTPTDSARHSFAEPDTSPYRATREAAKE